MLRLNEWSLYYKFSNKFPPITYTRGMWSKTIMSLNILPKMVMNHVFSVTFNLLAFCTTSCFRHRHHQGKPSIKLARKCTGSLWLSYFISRTYGARRVGLCWQLPISPLTVLQLCELHHPSMHGSLTCGCCSKPHTTQHQRPGLLKQLNEIKVNS